jgi:hypothetical protein
MAWTKNLLATGSVAMVVFGSSIGGTADQQGADADVAQYIRDFTVLKYFLVAGTFRSFASATIEAARLAPRVSLEFRQQTTQLEQGQPTYSRSACEEDGRSYPCYVARGRYDDGKYVSAEPSSAYEGMRSGYFVVIAASGNLEEVLQAQRELGGRHVTAVVRSAPVWMGCMH